MTRISGVVAALALSAAADEGGAGWKVERIATPASGPAFPKEVPEAFAKLLDPASGLRLLDAEKKPAVELWLRAELPLAEKVPATASNTRLGRIASGELVGVMKAFGTTGDYREQTIETGVYALRYFAQPADGNHLGTSDSRDFLILTSFAQDKDPAAIADQEKLMELARPISPSDHALVLYVTDVPAAAPAAEKDSPSFFQRRDKEEWALELVVPARVPDAKATEQLRLALVLLGHTAG